MIKKVGAAILAVVVVLLFVGLVASLSGGFTDWNVSEWFAKTEPMPTVPEPEPVPEEKAIQFTYELKRENPNDDYIMLYVPKEELSLYPLIGENVIVSINKVQNLFHYNLVENVHMWTLNGTPECDRGLYIDPETQNAMLMSATDEIWEFEVPIKASADNSNTVKDEFFEKNKQIVSCTVTESEKEGNSYIYRFTDSSFSDKWENACLIKEYHFVSNLTDGDYTAFFFINGEKIPAEWRYTYLGAYTYDYYLVPVGTYSPEKTYEDYSIGITYSHYFYKDEDGRGQTANTNGLLFCKTSGTVNFEFLIHDKK